MWIRTGFNANPYPAFDLNKNLDPDPGSQTNADLYLDPGQTLKSQKDDFVHEKNKKKVGNKLEDIPTKV